MRLCAIIIKCDFHFFPPWVAFIHQQFGSVCTTYYEQSFHRVEFSLAREHAVNFRSTFGRSLTSSLICSLIAARCLLQWVEKTAPCTIGAYAFSDLQSHGSPASIGITMANIHANCIFFCMNLQNWELEQMHILYISDFFSLSVHILKIANDFFIHASRNAIGILKNCPSFNLCFTSIQKLE